MHDNPWELIEQGKYEPAVEAYTLRIQQAPRYAPNYTNRAIAFLCLRKYSEAARDYREVMRLTSGVDGGYLGLGVCQWCMGQFMDGMATWRDGLGMPYTDAAGGVVIPALLLYAALRLRNVTAQGEAWGLLRKCMRRKQLENWPGAIVPYLLGKISQPDLMSSAQPPMTPEVLLERFRQQANFYVGVRGLLDGDMDLFQENMRECAASWYGYLEHEHYLAIWEVDNGFPNIGANDRSRTS